MIEQKKTWAGEYLNSVILVICHLIGMTEDQIKEGKPLGLNCASLQDVNDLSETILCNSFCVHWSVENALDNDFGILKDRSSKVPQQVELIVVDESHSVEIWTSKNVR